MPSGIQENDTMAYVGTTPWHGLGVKVEGEAMTAAQAIEAAELDWEVGLKKVYVRNRGKYEPVSGKNAVYRKDTLDVFGVVGSRYEPFQNVDQFKMFDPIVERGEAVYHTVGSLFNGKRVWVLARLPDNITLINGDPIEQYVLLSNTHDGSSSLTMQLTPIRVVCQNTLSVAMDDHTSGRFTARHTSQILSKASEAWSLLGVTHSYFKGFMETCNNLVEEKFREGDMESLARTLWAVKEDVSTGKLKGTTKRSIQTLMELFYSGTGNKGESKWDAYNAVAEFSDYMRPMGRSLQALGAVDEYSVNRRLEETWFGSGRKLRQQAMEYLTLS